LSIFKLSSFFLLSLFLLSDADAAIYKGQNIFIKKCIVCHKNGENFVAKHTKAEWEKLLRQDGKPLGALHLKTKKAKKSWKYFKSQKYRKKSKHLREFLVEYAKDSGKIPLF